MELYKYVYLLSVARSIVKYNKKKLRIEDVFKIMEDVFASKHDMALVHNWVLDILYPHIDIKSYIWHSTGKNLSNKQVRQYTLSWLKILIKQLRAWIKEDLHV